MNTGVNSISSVICNSRLNAFHSAVADESKRFRERTVVDGSFSASAERDFSKDVAISSFWIHEVKEERSSMCESKSATNPGSLGG
jgi:hypothetical protein